MTLIENGSLRFLSKVYARWIYRACNRLPTAQLSPLSNRTGRGVATLLMAYAFSLSRRHDNSRSAQTGGDRRQEKGDGR